jgi:hypothetical protein
MGIGVDPDYNSAAARGVPKPSISRIFVISSPRRNAEKGNPGKVTDIY